MIKWLFRISVSIDLAGMVFGVATAIPLMALYT
jgi:hypothetical protein